MTFCHDKLADLTKWQEGEGLRKWLSVRGVSEDTHLHSTCHLSATPDKMSDFVVNRPPLHDHQKFFTNSQSSSQSIVNSFI